MMAPTQQSAALAESPIISTALLLACYLLTDPRHPPTSFSAAAVNVNRVFGLEEARVQTQLHPMLFLGITILFYPLCIYLPTHILFQRIFRPCGRSRHPEYLGLQEQVPEMP